MGESTEVRLTDAELALVGLLAEQPRHGYRLEAVIAERGMREWTSLGFSSIYYVLNKLQARGLVSSERPARTKGRKVYSLTPAGIAACSAATRDALERVDPVRSSVLVGMANSPTLPPAHVAEALTLRRQTVLARIETIRATRLRQEPLQASVSAIFEHTIALLQAEAAWIEGVLTHFEESRLQPYDVKKALKNLYAARSGAFEILDVPEMSFLMVDGHGDPNTAPAYREAVEALYSASYAVRAVAKATTGRVHTVAPLEALWSAEDWEVFRTRDKDAWGWTLMIAQPDWITFDMVEMALADARRKKPMAALRHVGFERYREGRSVQILHVGSYDEEGPTLERLHKDFLPANALRPTGRHHEIYLSDTRKTPPAKLRTILRQPVTGAA
ncbi:MAG: GyrI-like domain-containing protein [Actinomycetota bacterium]|nr:GyrI-like domain-containing protein [Actinomycetota bacterium]